MAVQVSPTPSPLSHKLLSLLTSMLSTQLCNQLHVAPRSQTGRQSKNIVDAPRIERDRETEQQGRAE